MKKIRHPKESRENMMVARDVFAFPYFHFSFRKTKRTHYDFAFHDVYLRPIIAAFRKPFPLIKYISLYANQIFKEPRIEDNK